MDVEYSIDGSNVIVTGSFQYSGLSDWTDLAIELFDTRYLPIDPSDPVMAEKTIVRRGEGIEPFTFEIINPLSEINLEIISLSLSSNEPTVGVQVTISADFTNTGSADADDVTVCFYLDDNVLDEKTVNIPSDGTATTSTVWTAVEGTHDISVRIIEANLDWVVTGWIFDLNEWEWYQVDENQFTVTIPTYDIRLDTTITVSPTPPPTPPGITIDSSVLIGGAVAIGVIGVVAFILHNRPLKPPKIPPQPKPPVITPVPPPQPPRSIVGEGLCPPEKVRKEKKICRDALNKLLSNLTVDLKYYGKKGYLMESVPRLLKKRQNKMFNVLKDIIQWDTTATILASNLKAEKEILGDIREFQKWASFAKKGSNYTKTGLDALKKGKLTEEVIKTIVNEAKGELKKEAMKTIDKDIFSFVEEVKGLKGKLEDFVTKKIGYGIAKAIVGHDPQQVAITSRKKLEKLYEKLRMLGRSGGGGVLWSEIDFMEEEIKKIRHMINQFNKDTAGLRCVKCGTYRIPKLTNWIKQLEDLKRRYEKLINDVKTRLKNAEKLFKQEDAYRMFEKRFHPLSSSKIEKYFSK